MLSNQRGLTPVIMILGVVLMLALIGGAYYFGTQQNTLGPQSTPAPIATQSPQSTTKASPVSQPTATNSAQEKGASLKEIKYSLPTGWRVESSEDRLSFRSSDGGMLDIKVHPYKGESRREYYCQLVDFCIDSTYFQELKIGNLPGYIARSLDNSGGGSDIFGAKGDKFYIIGSHSPPNDPAVNAKLQQLMNSLVF